MVFYRCGVCGLVVSEMFKKCPSCGFDGLQIKEFYTKAVGVGELLQIALTKKEKDTLVQVLYKQNVCESRCIYPYMEVSEMDCNECEFPKLVDSMLSKLELK